MPDDARASQFGGLLPITTDSPAATREVGRQLAGTLHPGTVVALYGDLGAGKTELVRGICRGLGVAEDSVHSPTYTIVHEYRGRGGSVYHIDAYRLERIEEFFDLGYEDYFFSEGVTLIEWAERVEPVLPPGAIRIRLSHAGEDRRLIEAQSDG